MREKRPDRLGRRTARVRFNIMFVRNRALNTITRRLRRYTAFSRRSTQRWATCAQNTGLRSASLDHLRARLSAAVDDAPRATVMAQRRPSAMASTLGPTHSHDRDRALAEQSRRALIGVAEARTCATSTLYLRRSRSR